MHLAEASHLFTRMFSSSFISLLHSSECAFSISSLPLCIFHLPISASLRHPLQTLRRGNGGVAALRLHATACGMRAYTLAKQPFLHSSLFMLLLHSTIYVYDIGVLLISSINYPVLFTSILWLFERNRTKSVHLKGSTRSSASSIENV